MNAMAEIQQDDLEQKLKALRKLAVDGGLPVRRKDRDLYAIMAGCLALCEEIIRDSREPELREVFRVSVAGRGLTPDEARKGRRYAYPSSDAFILVCRYALADTETAQIVSKYSQALREAARRQIRAVDLPVWLRENGGILALYRSRPTLGARSGGVRTLELDKTIDFPRDGGAFTLTLRYDGNGFFHVLNQEDHHD